MVNVFASLNRLGVTRPSSRPSLTACYIKYNFICRGLRHTFMCPCEPTDGDVIITFLIAIIRIMPNLIKHIRGGGPVPLPVSVPALQVVGLSLQCFNVLDQSRPLVVEC